MTGSFLVVAVGRGHPEWIREALDSIASQTSSVRVHVVEDAGDQPARQMVAEIATHHGWDYTLRGEQQFALANQVHAWRTLEPNDDDDVIVFVDLDDRLADPDALQIVADAYAAGALMTYGSYRPFPAEDPNAATCRPAARYPAHIRAGRSYRQADLQHFNHLRTISWRLLKHLTDEDLRDDHGRYFRANTDRAVMWPCLEMADDRVAFIPQVLYEYRCDSSDAVWRTDKQRLIEENEQLRNRPKRKALK